MKHQPAIHLLTALRDWPRPKRPHAALILAVALSEAGLDGLRDRDLLRALARGTGSSSKPMAYLVAEDMVEPVPARDRKTSV